MFIFDKGYKHQDLILILQLNYGDKRNGVVNNKYLLKVEEGGLSIYPQKLVSMELDNLNLANKSCEFEDQKFVNKRKVGNKGSMCHRLHWIVL